MRSTLYTGEAKPSVLPPAEALFEVAQMAQLSSGTWDEPEMQGDSLILAFFSGRWEDSAIEEERRRSPEWANSRRRPESAAHPASCADRTSGSARSPRQGTHSAAWDIDPSQVWRYRPRHLPAK